MIFKAISTTTAFALGVASQGSYNRRMYYNALGCKADATLSIQVYYPGIPCIVSSDIVNSPCEDKSPNPQALSSEGTSCLSVAPGAASDAAFLPPLSQGTRVSTYIVSNSYSGQDSCDFKVGKTTYEQRAYAADGKCYAAEKDEYFKASCNGAVGEVFYCRDPACTDCSGMRYLKFDGTCQVNQGTDPIKGVCMKGSDIGAAPVGSGAGSGTASGSSTSPTSSPKSGPKNAAFGQNDGTIVGIALALLTALFL